MAKLWDAESVEVWRSALRRYPEVIGAQDVSRLVELDGWYRDEFPSAIAARARPHITHAELVRVTEWKMARGVWRGRNLALVRGNDPKAVTATSASALADLDGSTEPIRQLAALAGVGPATASAIAAAAAPKVYPFFDDLVANQIPDLGEVAYTIPYYGRYAEALRARAGQLGARWTPADVERALWADSGGKAGVRRVKSEA